MLAKRDPGVCLGFAHLSESYPRTGSRLGPMNKMYIGSCSLGEARMRNLRRLVLVGTLSLVFAAATIAQIGPQAGAQQQAMQERVLPGKQFRFMEDWLLVRVSPQFFAAVCRASIEWFAV
jgi:hypothetical protein